jgi:hypothetical protein
MLDFIQRASNRGRKEMTEALQRIEGERDLEQPLQRNAPRPFEELECTRCDPSTASQFVAAPASLEPKGAHPGSQVVCHGLGRGIYYG